MLLNVSLPCYLSRQSYYKLVLNFYSENTMPYQTADLALLSADKKLLSHR